MMTKSGTSPLANYLSWLILVPFIAMMSACKSGPGKEPTLFTKVSSDDSGIDFANKLEFDKDFNIYTYRNYYNGGGVAMGDINNDGLVDIYLTGNLTPNKLYLNLGDFKFKDITDLAGVAGKGAWATGVSMADVNGDGLMDIYVCNSGDIKGDNKQNELFINDGDSTFTERAEEYGVADKGYSTHAAFFDYDKDGDLDLYILNNSYQPIGSFNLRNNVRRERDVLGGDKLLRNDGNKFTDVSEAAGIFGSVIGFGLGVTVGDVDKDGWLDIYVSNDFFERDYLYINNKNGTFKECLPDQMKSISGASMGADLADINNDTYADIFVTEMLPQDNSRLKTVTTFENWDRYQFNVQNDYYHQFTRNMLQLNNGNNTFSEIGRLSGVEATDWSWGALLFDMDNDGLKDIFVSNGIFQDLTNQDYLQYVSSPEVVKSVVAGKAVNYKMLVDKIPSTPIPDFAFKNLGDLHFEDKAKAWGLGEPNFSNGAAYGDLDNDGDLDLVVSNVNDVCSVFQNGSDIRLPQNHYLKFELKGKDRNTGAFGTKITIKNKAQIFYLEQMPIRGFQSSMDPRPNIGLGNIEKVEQIVVQWPDGNETILKDVATNQTIKLDQSLGVDVNAVAAPDVTTTILQRGTNQTVDFTHVENSFVDFDRDRLIFHMLSTEGPRMSKGDINGDGREDFFIGGAKDQPGALFVQAADGNFKQTNKAVFEVDKGSEDMGSIFFDADNDGDQDLYVCSGGTEFANSSRALMDRLYINDGKGNLTKSAQVLPTYNFENKSTVKAGDYDNDGDADLFVGVRLLSYSYGAPMNGYILNNDGKGNFKNVTSAIAPSLKEIGMITDAIWSDVDGDKDLDLVIVGEYMPIRVLINNEGKFSDNTEQAGLGKTNGWWNRISAADLDNDGDVDFVVGNHGLNSRFRATYDKPVCMYVNDFDQNGTVEQVVCTYVGDKSFPLVLRHDLVSQIPSLKKRYLKYENFVDQTVNDIFTPEQLKGAAKLNAYELASSVLINNGAGKFTLMSLPTVAQMSPIYGVEIMDVDNDSIPDLFLGGNLYGVKPEAGRYDASYGIVLKGDGRGNFAEIPRKQSGFDVDGQVRDMIVVRSGKDDIILVARNNDKLVSFKKTHRD